MIRAGVVGFGYWGPNVVRNFEIPGRCQVVAVADLDPAMLKRAVERFPGIATTSAVEDLWHNPSIDAVAIATPVSSHFALAQAALKAGKHVFVEKPITETSEQAKRLIELAAAKNRVLMIDHTFVYTPAVQRIRQLIQTGAIGRIYYYDSQRINLGLFQHDVNVLWDLAVHDLSILDYVLDARPYAVCAVGMRHLKDAPESVAYMSLFLPDDAIAHINVNWLAPVKVRRTLISGSKKMLVFDDLEPSEKLKIYDRGITFNAAPTEAPHETLIGYRTGDMWAPNLAVTEALHTAALHFLACLEGRETPITGGEMGLRLVQTLELATVSMAQQGAPVQFPGT
jgi:predicted dehydrogenase